MFFRIKYLISVGCFGEMMCIHLLDADVKFV